MIINPNILFPDVHKFIIMPTDTKDWKKEQCLAMADTIMKSICISVDEPTIMSWGISKLTATCYEDMPSLKIQVNGFLHKGTVLVSYDEGNDYFQIRLLDKKKKPIKTVEDVCFTDLGRFIDRMVEREEDISDSEYRKRIFNSLIAG